MARKAQDSSERSPLLQQQNEQANGNVETSTATRTEGQTHQEPQNVNDEIAVAEEPSLKKLLAIMLSTWIGTFFSALGE